VDGSKSRVFSIILHKECKILSRTTLVVSIGADNLLKRVIPIASILLILFVLPSGVVSPVAAVSVGQSEYISVSSIESPSVALPGQRIVIHVLVSYQFASAAWIGISVATPGATNASAQSLGGLVDPSRGDELTSSRGVYLALMMPRQTGNMQYIVRAFFAHGSQAWQGTEPDGKAFSILVSNSDGFSLQPNSFSGGLVLRRQTPTYAVINSLRVTRTSDLLSFSLSIVGSTDDAHRNRMFYDIDIDATNELSSVTFGVTDYAIRIYALDKPTTGFFLDAKTGKQLKILQVSSNANGYTVTGLSVADIGGYNFNMVAGAVQRKTSTTATYGSCFSGVYFIVYSSENWVCPPSYSTTTTDTVLAMTPAGGWAPVTIPIAIDITTPTDILLDGMTQQPSGGIVDVQLPSGWHEIVAPPIVAIDETSRLRFDHWSDGSTGANRSVEMTSDLTLGADYVKQYHVTMTSPLSVFRDDWVDEGSSLTFSQPPSPQPVRGPLGMLGGKWVFDGWYDSEKLLTNLNSVVISVNSPHFIEAKWHADYRTPLAIIALIAIVIVAAAYLIVRRRAGPRRRKSSGGTRS
jgi:hypothetical protein